MKRKFNRNQKHITPRDIQPSSLIYLLILFKFKSSFTFSFKNVLWLPESNSIRNVDFLVSFKLQKHALTICNKTTLFVQLLTFTAAESVCRDTELFKFPPRPAVWFDLGEIVLKLKVLESELTVTLVLSFFKQIEDCVSTDIYGVCNR